MTRLPDWEERLGAYIARVRDRPFVYGEHDCILHSCAAAEAQTGVDHAAQFRGKYASKREAAEVLKTIGAGTLFKTIDARFTRKKPAFAQRGDIVWFAGSAGVCMGAEALFVGEERLAEAAGIVMREGLVSVPRRLWLKAWVV